MNFEKAWECLLDEKTITNGTTTIKIEYDSRGGALGRLDFRIETSDGICLSESLDRKMFRESNWELV